jgi:hypothetical protein
LLSCCFPPAKGKRLPLAPLPAVSRLS